MTKFYVPDANVLSTSQYIARAIVYTSSDIINRFRKDDTNRIAPEGLCACGKAAGLMTAAGLTANAFYALTVSLYKYVAVPIQGSLRDLTAQKNRSLTDYRQVRLTHPYSLGTLRR